MSLQLPSKNSNAPIDFRSNGNISRATSVSRDRIWNATKFSRVGTWQGALILAFFAGAVAASAWLVSFNLESESMARVDRPVELLEAMRLRGCIADGLLSGYGGDTETSVELVDRSECVYLHRALESWLNPPDFELARRIRATLSKPDLIFGMFISEALNTSAQYYSSEEDRVLDFSKMCLPGSEGFWGANTCKASFENEEYRAYVADITRKAMDMGVQSFLFGQISFQDPSRKQAEGILRDMRSYASKKRMKIAIGAQTNTISDRKYLDRFDYIEGGVGIDANGNVEEKPCASRYEKAGWCWALLWNKKYSSSADMVLLHLDWSGIAGDDMSVFAAMSREERAETLRKLHDKFNVPGGKTGFLFPFLATLYDDAGGCYGANRNFYSPDNRYSCKDEDAINELLRATPLSGAVASSDDSSASKKAGSISEEGKLEERDDAEFEKQDVPDTMVAGMSYTVSVTLKNSGTTVWTDEGKYRLGSQRPQDNSIWGGRVFLFPGKRVLPKKKITFSFTVKAPEKPGSYDFQWRMLREGQSWFGESTKNKVVTVVSGQETTDRRQ